jgi:hydrogenase nickel incorporation protein HypA/HybF
VPVIVFCDRCNAARTLRSVQLFCCSECGIPTPDIRQGKELELVALEIEQ